MWLNRWIPLMMIDRFGALFGWAQLCAIAPQLALGTPEGFCRHQVRLVLFNSAALAATALGQSKDFAWLEPRGNARVEYGLYSLRLFKYN
jgi:hypothetical protein